MYLNVVIFLVLLHVTTMDSNQDGVVTTFL